MVEHIKYPKYNYNEPGPPEIVSETLPKIRKSIKKYKDKIKELNERVGKESFIKCPECENQSAVVDWYYVPVYYYVSPRGCTGGDYYAQSDGFCLKCPECNSYLRCYHPDASFDKSWINFMKHEQSIYRD